MGECNESQRLETVLSKKLRDADVVFVIRSLQKQKPKSTAFSQSTQSFLPTFFSFLPFSFYLLLSQVPLQFLVWV